jgi:hypothetical protein
MRKADDDLGARRNHRGAGRPTADDKIAYLQSLKTGTDGPQRALPGGTP